MPIIKIRNLGSSPPIKELDLREVQNGKTVSISKTSYNNYSVSGVINKSYYQFRGYYYDDNNGRGSANFSCPVVNLGGKFKSLTLSASGMNNGCILYIYGDGAVIASYSSGNISDTRISIKGVNNLQIVCSQKALLWKPKDQNGDASYEYRSCTITKALISTAKIPGT